MKLLAFGTGILSWLDIPVILDSLYPRLRRTIGCYRAQGGNASSWNPVWYAMAKLLAQFDRSALEL
jgi:hypothetical protein